MYNRALSFTTTMYSTDLPALSPPFQAWKYVFGELILPSYLVLPDPDAGYNVGSGGLEITEVLV